MIELIAIHSKMLLVRMIFMIAFALPCIKATASNQDVELERHSSKLDHGNLARLSEMLRRSRVDASKSLQEVELLRGLKRIKDDHKDNSASNNTSPSNDTNPDSSDDSLTSVSAHESGHSKNDARQSSLFSGLGLGGSNSAFQNPLASGMFKPMTLPPIPTLPALSLEPPTAGLPSSPLAPPPPPPRPPKTSILGGGGPMALTNDNVVVVNVFSNN